MDPITKKLLTDQLSECRSLLKSEQRTNLILSQNAESLRLEQEKLVKSNNQLRKDLSILSKGSRLSEEIIKRAQRYRKERDMLADEVEKLRYKISKFELKKEEEIATKEKVQEIIRETQRSSKRASILKEFPKNGSSGVGVGSCFLIFAVSLVRANFVEMAKVIQN